LPRRADLQLAEQDDSSCRPHLPKVWQGICDREQYWEAASWEEKTAESVGEPHFRVWDSYVCQA